MAKLAGVASGVENTRKKTNDWNAAKEKELSRLNRMN
jgi:hypothetical protein